MNLESLLLFLGLGLIAVIANAMSAFAGGGAGLVQLPALILLGLPFFNSSTTFCKTSEASFMPPKFLGRSLYSFRLENRSIWSK